MSAKKYYNWIEVILLAVLTCFQISCGQKPIPIEKGVAQLFVDDYLIESQENVKRTLHQPVKDFGGAKPIIVLEDEFGDLPATLEANGTIIYDPRIRKYVMFALGFSLYARVPYPDRRWEFYRRYRFTSEDGINWVKGDDGTPQSVYPRSHNDLYDPESDTYARNIDVFSCYYDVTDPEYPYKGWQFYSVWGGDRAGIYFEKSKDGIFWERGTMVINGISGRKDPNYRIIHQNERTLAGAGDVTIFYHDAIENRFLAIFKFKSIEPAENGNFFRSRAYAFLNPPLEKPFDLNQIHHIEFVPPAKSVNNDMPHDEFYGSTAWRYESLWLGGLKIWHKGGDYPWSAAGGAFIKLVSSRDGLNWSKVSFQNDDGVPEIFIPNGDEGGNDGQNDGGYITDFSQGPLRIGNELIFYYGSSSWGKNHPDSIALSGGGIFRARLRIDGFVSVDAGQLTTREMALKGPELSLNAIGPVIVDVLSSAGKVIASQTVEGDSLRHRVTFNGKSLAEITNNQSVRLRFTVGAGGHLYSFKVDD